ncbi:MAG: hypothetical protein P9M14_00545 [Candidatus Alcyoniella australis]|nr:hypothetical protein [Candidatus Alcyoniella australis]
MMEDQSLPLKPPPEDLAQPEVDAEQAQQTALEMVRYAIRIEKGQMRTTYMAQRLNKMSDDTAIAVLDALCTGAGLSIHGFQETLIDLVDPESLREHLGSFKLSRIYHGARRRGISSILRFMTQERPLKVQQQPSEENMLYGMSDVPLGVRRYVARLQDKRQLERAAYDQDPNVIVHLLRNSRTTRQTVLKIASRRPNEAAVLEAVFRSKRWIADNTVKEALVRNPYTPLRIALSLLNVLQLQQVRDVARDSGLHPEIKKATRELLARKLQRSDRD